MVGRLEIHSNYVILAKYRKVLHEHSKMLPLEPNLIPRNYFSTLCNNCPNLSEDKKKPFDHDQNSEAQNIQKKLDQQCQFRREYGRIMTIYTTATKIGFRP